MILDIIREQVEALRRPLAAVSLTTLPRKSSPLLLLLHWHGFLPQERTRSPSSPPVHLQAPLPSSALQLSPPWDGLGQVDSLMLAAAWRMGAWDLTREHRRGCSAVGAPMREAVECRQAFGDNPLAPDDETHLIAEAPDRLEMRDIAARLGYIRWLFRPVAEGLWRSAGTDDSLSPDGSRELPCPIEPHPRSLGTDSRHRYQLGRVDRILLL
jgi:hypothetical protein